MIAFVSAWLTSNPMVWGVIKAGMVVVIVITLIGVVVTLVKDRA